MLTVHLKDELGRDVCISGASSILAPRDNTVVFVADKMRDMIGNLANASGCLVYVLNGIEVADDICCKHMIVYSDNPRRDFGRFLEENNAESHGKTTYRDEFHSVISNDSLIGNNVTIFPGCYIENDVKIGEGSIIHSGVRLLAGTTIGRNCVIHDNVVIGSLSMAYEGQQRIPQIGGVWIGDNVHIGALSVVCRGALDDTVIESDVKIDNCCSIAHNDHIGKGTFIICGTKLFGSVHVGKGTYISGGTTVKNGLRIGASSIVGLGSVVIRDVEPDNVVVGNPARVLRKKGE